MNKFYVLFLCMLVSKIITAQPVLLDPVSHPKFQNPLPTPTKISVGATTTTMQMAQTTQWLGLVSPTNAQLNTTVWGYGLNGISVSYPGPTLVATKNSVANIEWVNNLPAQHLLPMDATYHSAVATSGIPTVVHLHGGHTEAASDGHPDAWYTSNYTEKGALWSKPVYTYDNTQEGATLWYHDHALGMTRLNVYAGLAGFYLLNDANEQAINLPSNQYEREIVIQDRMFDSNGQLYLPAMPNTPSSPNPSGQPEFFGDFIVVNGMVWPFMDVEPRQYRLRLLNGSDSRVYEFSLSNNATFLQIATDDGKLNTPVTKSTLTLAPGERAEIIVDFSTMIGQQITLLNTGPDAPYGNPASPISDPATTGQIMQFRVNQPLNTAIPVTNISTATNLRPSLGAIQDVGAANKTRQVALFEGTDELGRILPMLGIVDPTNPNDGSLTWHDPVTENVNLNDTEIWEIYNTTADAHPVHLHLVSFQILSKQTFTGTLTAKDQMLHSGGMGTGSILSNIVLTGSPTTYTPAESGWKDTHILMPGEMMKIKAKFDLTGDYVWHCHILSHEDHDMMRKLIVGNPCGTDVIPPSLSACPANITLTTSGTCATANWTAPTATDNCTATPSISFTTSPTVNLTNGGCFPIGTTTVTYMAMDNNNNMSTCSFTVTVTSASGCTNDLTPPVLSACPPNQNLTTGTTCATATWTAPTATDNCTTPSVSFTTSPTANLTNGGCFPIGATTVNYTAIDGNNNISNCSFIVNVTSTANCANDVTPPVFDICPANINVTTTGTCANANWVAPIATDNCGVPTVTQTAGLTFGSCFPIGTNTITYTATDAKNNKSTCSFNVIVQNQTTPPTTCTNNLLINSSFESDLANWQTTNSGTNNTVVIGTTANSGTKALEVCTGAGSASQLVTATANKVYTLSFYGKVNGINYADIGLEFKDAAFNLLNYDPAVNQKSITSTNYSNYTLTLTAPAGTAYAQVSLFAGSGGCVYVDDFCLTEQNTADCTNDAIAPVLTACPANINLTTAGTTATASWTAPTATDNCGTPTVSFTTSPTANLTNGGAFPIGTTTVTYMAMDAKNNMSTCSFTVNVTQVSTNCPNNLLTNSGFENDLTNWQTTNSGTNNTVVIGTTANSGTKALEVCTGVGSASQVVPATANKTYTLSFYGKINGINYADIGLEFKDAAFNLLNYDPAVNQKSITSTNYSNYTLTLTAPAGTTYAQVSLFAGSGGCVYVDDFCLTEQTTDPCATDVTAPTLTACPANISLTTTGTTATASWTAPTATDNCGTPSVSFTTSPTANLTNGGAFPIGTTTVTYMAMDAKNNMSTCSFTVTVTQTNPCTNDVTPPVLTACPANISLTTTGTTATASWTAPTATDNCGTPTVSFTTSPTANLTNGGAFPIGTTTVTYIAMDAKNNMSTCSFTVTVTQTNPCTNDVTKPVLTACPANISLTTTGTTATASWTAPTATDNCGTPTVSFTTSPTANLTNGGAFPIGTTTVTYMAMDAKNNMSTCSFTVTVTQTNPCTNDVTKPVLTACPANISLTTTGTTAIASWTAPTATDNCGTPTVSFTTSPTANLTNGGAFPIGTTTVTYMAMDAKNNMSTCSFTVTVTQTNPCTNDVTAPVLTACPTNISLTTTGTTATASWSAPTATDNCSVPTVAFVTTPTANLTNGGAFPIGTTTVTYTATDAKGNKATCSFSVTVTKVDPCTNDVTAPILTACPANISLTTTGTTSTASWTAPTATDNCGTPTVSFSTSPTANLTNGGAFPIGTTTVTYMAMDAKNNMSTCSFTVTVTQTNPCTNDVTPPVLTTCPANISLTTTGTSAIATWTAPTATDNCGTATVTSTHASGASFNIGTTTVTYTATDAKGNKATCSFTVTVSKIDPCATDVIAPVFTGCPANISLTTTGLTAVATWTAPTATDNCSATTITSTHASGTSFNVGTTTVTYTATDAKGNKATCTFTVTVTKISISGGTLGDFVWSDVNGNGLQDSGEPGIGGVKVQLLSSTRTLLATTTTDANGKYIFTGLAGATYILKYITPTGYTITIKDAVSNTKNDLDSDIDANGEDVVVLSANTTNITKDAGYKPSACVNDAIVPVFAGCPTNISLTTTGTAAVATWTAPTATDNCSTPTVTGSHISGTSFNIGTTTVTYTATDAKGNKATCTFTVTVTKIDPCLTDVTAPVFTGCPASITLTTTGTTAVATWTAPTATDNCSTPTVTSTHASGASFNIGTTTVTYTATDAKGNKATCLFSVIVTKIDPCTSDITAPVFTGCPANITLTTSGSTAVATWTAPKATDNCSTPTLTSTHASGASFNVGTTTVTYTATDAKGNKATCTFTVTVTKVDPCATDVTAPVITGCPANITLTTSGSTAVATWTAPKATDNCSTPTLTSTHTSGSSFNVGTTTVTYTATDAKGNKATCTFTVTVTVPVCTVNFSSTKCYRIVNRQSGKVLDVSGGKTSLNTPIIQWPYSGGTNQQVRLNSLGSGYFKIVFRNSGRVLANHSITSYSKCYLYDYYIGGAKDWKIECLTNGYYKITHRLSGKILSITGNSTADGAITEIRNWDGGNGQQWAIEEVACNTSSWYAYDKTVLNVDATASYNRSLIQWVNNTGERNDYFAVQRLNPETGDYIDLKVVNTSFNSADLESYLEYDNAPLEGDNYYRIKLVLKDGTITYSEVKKVTFGKQEVVNIFPNPAESEIFMDLKAYSGSAATIYMYNHLGQIVQTKQIDKVENTFVRLDVNNLITGQYHIRIVSKDKRDFNKKVSITH